MSEHTLHKWTDREGVRWECDAYDHGPFCRQCRRVDEPPSSPQWPLTDLTGRLRALHEVWANEAADRLEKAEAKLATLCVSCGQVPEEGFDIRDDEGTLYCDECWQP